jgi:hypothetical protein
LLKKAATDGASISIRIAAADSLLRLGEAELAAPVFKKAMQHPLDIARPALPRRSIPCRRARGFATEA